MSESNEDFDLDISWYEIENEIKYTIKINPLKGYTKEEVKYFFKEFKQSITQAILPYFTESIEESQELSQ